jgi:hypothetical protein
MTGGEEISPPFVYNSKDPNKGAVANIKFLQSEAYKGGWEEKKFHNEYKDYKAGDTSGNELKKVASSSRNSNPVRMGKAMAPEGNIISSTS